jgi:MFS family permease
MTGVIAMDQFQATFNTGKTGTLVAVIFSIYAVGSIVCAPFAAILSDKFGRRVAMFAGGVVIIIGVAIISSSFHVPQLIVGRFVLGVGIAIMTVAAPAYAVEISPPHWRGRCTGMVSCIEVVASCAPANPSV